METLKEFTQFRLFISEDVLVVFYLLCVILIPFAAWYFLFWAIRRYSLVIELYKSGRYSVLFSFLVWIIRKIRFFRDKFDEQITWSSFTSIQKLKFIALFLFIVVLAELFLRLMFEYLIAYMQMHELLKMHDMQT